MKKLLITTCIMAILSGCKKEKAQDTPKNTFSYGGNTKELFANTVKLLAQDCLTNGTTTTKTPGMQLYFYNNDVILLLNVIGENKGKYSGFTATCNDYKFKYTSTWQYRDPVKTGFIGYDSELNITKFSNYQISGNFKIRVEFDKDNLNDSFIVGKFEDLPISN